VKYPAAFLIPWHETLENKKNWFFCKKYLGIDNYCYCYKKEINRKTRELKQRKKKQGNKRIRIESKLLQ